MNANNVRCLSNRESCFAYNEGRCRCLNDTDFKGKPCPFYDTRETVDAKDAAVHKRLKKLGMEDLYWSYRPGGKTKGHKEVRDVII